MLVRFWRNCKSGPSGNKQRYSQYKKDSRMNPHKLKMGSPYYKVVLLLGIY